jgi:hypothetical protein
MFDKYKSISLIDYTFSHQSSVIVLKKKIKPQPQFSMTRTSNRRGGRGDKPEKGGSGASKATTGGTEKKSHTLTIKNSTLTGS